MSMLVNVIMKVVLKRVMNEQRTVEQLREHYEIEKELADRLRNAQKQERRHLYTLLYDELYVRVPHHSQITRKADAEAQRDALAGQLKFLTRFLRPDATFVEIGSGDCELSKEVATLVKEVVAIEVSREITKSDTFPRNFKLVLSDGCSIPVPNNSVDIVYSYQLMEHLHPDDAYDQVHNVYNTLVRGGQYVCITPNRLSGPHDISKYFDEGSTGFHLKEYTVAELAGIFKAVGFSKLRVSVSARGYFVLVPLFPIRWVESLLLGLPYRLRRKIAGVFPFRSLLGINLVAKK